MHLTRIEAVKPIRIIPGHFVGNKRRYEPINWPFRRDVSPPIDVAWMSWAHTFANSARLCMPNLQRCRSDRSRYKTSQFSYPTWFVLLSKPKPLQHLCSEYFMSILESGCYSAGTHVARCSSLQQMNSTVSSHCNRVVCHLPYAALRQVTNERNFTRRNLASCTFSNVVFFRPKADEKWDRCSARLLVCAESGSIRLLSQIEPAAKRAKTRAY